MKKDIFKKYIMLYKQKGCEKMKNTKKILSITVLCAGVCLALFVLPEFKKENNLEDANQTTEVEKPSIDEGESTLEDIMEQAIDNSIQNAAEDILEEHLIESETNNQTDRLGGFYDALKSIDSKLDQPETNYRLGYVQKVLNGESFVAQIDGEEKVVKLIGIKDGSGNYDILNQLFSEDNSIYLEFDIKRYSGDEALCYAWLAVPDKDHLENMLNYLMLANNVGVLDRDTSPNIKYNNVLSKAYSNRNQK